MDVAAKLIATCDLSRSVDRIGEAVSPVAWNDDRRRDPANVREGYAARLVAVVTDKVARIIQPIDDRFVRPAHIEFRKDAAVEKVAVSESIAPDIPTANQPLVRDAPSLGIRPIVSLGSTIGGLNVPSAKRTKPR